MKFRSTRHLSTEVSFAEALWHPKPADGGLYLPQSVPLLPKAVLDNMSQMSLAEIGYVVFKPFLSDDFSAAQIKDIVESAYNFPTPLLQLDKSTYVLELFDGPTLAFKDYGARVTAAMLKHTARKQSGKPVNVFISTTGNTGSAMANALAGEKDINVFVVFPRGTATRALESQFTTSGSNVYPVEVNGSIDACYTLVETALNDRELNRHLTMMSVNSGNIARILGQTVYYFYGVSRLLDDGRHPSEIVVSLPCGNLGNLTAGIIAKRMGLPISKFIACENQNNYLTRALCNDDFQPRPATPTLAYAADKSVPTNLERIIDLYGDNTEKLLEDIVPVTVSDADIIAAINGCYDRFGYLLDPHSAMAYSGLERNIDTGQTGLILATAHPAKSLTAMSAITGRPIEMPLQLNRFLGKEDRRIRIKPIYQSLRHIVMNANK